MQCLSQKLRSDGLTLAHIGPPKHLFPTPAEPQGFFLWAYQACCRDSQLSFTATLHPSPALPIVPLPLGQQARLSRRERGRAGPGERLTVLLWSYKPGMSQTINSPPSVLINRPWALGQFIRAGGLWVSS